MPFLFLTNADAVEMVSTFTIGPSLRDEVVTIDPGLARLLGDAVTNEFRAQALRMPTLSRRLLLEGMTPTSVAPEALLSELQLEAGTASRARHGLGSRTAILQRPGILPASACARLRAAVEQKCDTVDGSPDEQLNLSAAQLDELIADPSASAALWGLPAEFLLSDSQDDGGNYGSRAACFADSCAKLRLLPDSFAPESAEIFVRRYAADSRPWNPFHTDSAALTLNLALIDDEAFHGGELLACHDGAVRVVARREGDATVHASSLLHGVRLITSGVRYSLIIFFGRNRADAEALAALEAEAEDEAEALATIMRDTSFLSRCEATLGGAASVEQLHRDFVSVQRSADGGLGALIALIVHRYGAPHLRPTQILKAAANSDAVCWSLRALLRYAVDLLRK
jgi:predicted 2-oxoglutarate/Fe(II)-dependent dioxygenase YbiX